MTAPLPSNTSPSATAAEAAPSFHGFAQGVSGQPEAMLGGPDTTPGLAQNFMKDWTFDFNNPDILASLPQTRDHGTEDISMSGGDDLLSSYNIQNMLFGIEGATNGESEADDDTRADGSSPPCVHNCAEAPLEALGALKPPIHLHWPHTSMLEPRDLGEILKTSRSALETASHVVSCGCMATNDIALLTTLVLLRILHWYETILKSNSGTSTGTRKSPSLGSPVSQVNSQSNGAAGRDPYPDGMSATHSLSMPPMKIGNYELALEDRPIFLMHVIQSELHKLGSVLDVFLGKFSTEGEQLLQENNNERFNLILENFVRVKYTAMVKKIQQNLSTV